MFVILINQKINTVTSSRNEKYLIVFAACEINYPNRDWQLSRTSLKSHLTLKLAFLASIIRIVNDINVNINKLKKYQLTKKTYLKNK